MAALEMLERPTMAQNPMEFIFSDEDPFAKFSLDPEMEARVDAIVEDIVAIQGLYIKLEETLFDAKIQALDRDAFHQRLDEWLAEINVAPISELITQAATETFPDSRSISAWVAIKKYLDYI